MVKVCHTCKVEKDSSCFALERGRKTPCLRYQCKDCDRLYQIKYRQKNKSKKKEYNTSYYMQNKLFILKQVSEYYINNRNSALERVKAYTKENKDVVLARRRLYDKRKRATDPEYKLIRNVRSLLRASLKENNIAKKGRSFEYTALTGKELMDYFETLFQPGMTRDGQGIGLDKWHVDHIKPIAAFDKTDPNWIYEAFHYTNLQPLWSEDNLNKSSMYEGILYRKTSKRGVINYE